MTNDIKALIDYYEREKGLSREKILLALESAFLSAYRKMVPGSGSINYLRAEINVDKGKVRIFADLEVVPDEEYSDKFNQIPLSLAVKLDKNAVLHDLLPTNITPKGFGRIAVQTARQTMLQKLLDAEKEMLYDEFKDRAGDLVTGTIRRFEKGDIFVDLGKFEGVMTSRERVPNEDYSVGDRMRFYVVEVRTEARGPEVILSRSHPNLVRRLFESEVVEIGDQTVEIHGIAREAGYRTKVAVISHDDKVDPVGACVGMQAHGGFFRDFQLFAEGFGRSLALAHDFFGRSLALAFFRFLDVKDAHLDIPAHQAGGEAGILAPAADGLGEVFVVLDDNEDFSGFLVHGDFPRFHGAESFPDEGDGVFRPFQDVHFFIVELPDDVFDAGAAHAYACPYRIYFAKAS